MGCPSPPASASSPFPPSRGGGSLSPFVPFAAAPAGAQPGRRGRCPGLLGTGRRRERPRWGAAVDGCQGWGCSGVMEEEKAELSLRRCCREPPARTGAGTETTDRPLPCLPPVQGSHGCRQAVPQGLAPRGQGSLEQERRWKQYLEDERIALFLQNEEFMKELQRNRDFLLALERGETHLQKPLPPLFRCVPRHDTGCRQHCPAHGIVARAKAEPAQDTARLVAGSPAR